MLSSCRAVVLASGTLAPVEGLAAQLFPSLVPHAPHSPAPSRPAPTPAAPRPPAPMAVLAPPALPAPVSRCPEGGAPMAQLVAALCPARLLGDLGRPGTEAGAGVGAGAQGAGCAGRPLLHYECGHVVPQDQVRSWPH